MPRKFLAMTLATVMALTSVQPTQAHALTDQEAGQLLGGLLTLFVISKALTDDDDDDRTGRAHVRPRGHDQDRDRWHGGWRDGIRDGDRSDRPRIVRPGRPRVLPADCLREVRTSGRSYRYFASYCLQRNFTYYNRLPSRCEVRVRRPNGLREGYGAACLREAGYRTDRGR